MTRKLVRTRRWLTAGGGVLAAGGLVCLLIAGSHQADQARPAKPVPRVKTAVCAAVEAEEARAYPGRVQANRTAVLAFRVGGPLVAMPAQPGRTVAKNALLAQIDPRDYVSRLAEIDASLAEARARLRAMKAGERAEMVAVRKAQLAAAEATLAEARVDYERVSALHEREVATNSELDRSRCAYLTAKAQVKVAEENLKISTAGSRQEDIDAMEAQIRSLEARRALADAAKKDTELCAPFEGRVARTMVENHAQVKEGEAIVVLQDVGTVEILIDVPEKQIARTAPGEFPPARAHFAFLPHRSFPLTWKEMDTVADAQTQTYPVTLTMAVPKGVQILPGMSAEVRVASSPAAAGRVRVPAEAVCDGGQGGARLWRVDPKTRRVHAVAVRPGPVSEGTLTVEGPLAPGDRVVSAGARLLVEDMQVRPE